MFWCWCVVLLKNSCLSLLSISSCSKLSALFDLPGLWQSHNKETCNMNQWYISVSQRMQVMEITVIGYYWTSGSLGLEKRSSYQFHCSKKSPFFVSLKPLIAMAVTFGPQFWDHPHGVSETVWSIGIIPKLQFLLVLSQNIPPEAVRLWLLQCISGISKPALAKMQHHWFFARVEESWSLLLLCRVQWEGGSDTVSLDHSKGKLFVQLCVWRWAASSPAEKFSKSLTVLFSSLLYRRPCSFSFFFPGNLTFKFVPICLHGASIKSNWLSQASFHAFALLLLSDLLKNTQLCLTSALTRKTLKDNNCCLCSAQGWFNYSYVLACPVAVGLYNSPVPHLSVPYIFFFSLIL